MGTYSDNLPDRFRFVHKLQRVIDVSESGSTELALIVIDIRGYRKFNSRYGPLAGDELLERVAQRLCGTTREHDWIARIGDDEFALVLPGILGEGHAMLAANKVIRTLQAPFPVCGDATAVQVAMGIALWPRHGRDAQGLIRDAEMALASSRNAHTPFEMYSSTQSDEIERIWQIEKDLDKALENDEFEVYFQPKIDLSTHLPSGVEALLRWHSPVYGILTPGAFIHIAEQSERIDRLSWWVLKAALRQSRDWPAPWDGIPVSVNVPATVLQDPDLVELIHNEMQVWATPPRMLTLEITETIAMNEPETSFETLRRLRATNVNISIDDFGTGYSSLAYFKNMPADEVKIDQSFVFRMLQDEGDSTIVETVIQLAHNFGFHVVAEGIENKETLDALADMGCDAGQGYHIARPMPQHDLVRWLEAVSIPG